MVESDFPAGYTKDVPPELKSIQENGSHIVLKFDGKDNAIRI